jgi:hypothetical protein
MILRQLESTVRMQCRRRQLNIRLYYKHRILNWWLLMVDLVDTDFNVHVHFTVFFTKACKEQDSTIRASCRVEQGNKHITICLLT